ncbi:hypothetical protein FB45DRAFT_990906 [Roridomyces roridus]|uniref:Zn(2)-C6 fungal-type domain-containing protein n=1 Tax=Roridomyces roridus TaxID=1738132 RepID=A0AAD7BV13_9AGAR|nr:hypothetical protein FB45DRAFT_990906 [Roridomyces roridus]
MPKAATVSVLSNGGTRPAPHLNPLKRNQACHQCRRRKLKCDAKRPACSTCIRSHSHAVAHAQPGTQLPPAPECTFDDVVDMPVEVADSSKSRYEKLESRIHELEALLHDKSSPSSSSTPSLAQPTASHFMGNDLDLLTTSLTESPPLDFISPAVLGTPGGSPRSATGLEMVWPHYPPGLPNAELLRHLVEVFFVFHPHANRVLHYPSFMASLTLSPSHPKFPATPILHAICAIGSLYTAAVSSPPLPNFAEVEADEIFTSRNRAKETRPDSFAEEQAKYARDTADILESLGDRLFETLQARTILSWFYWSHSRWLEVFLSSSHCLRVAVPLGLNVCPPFHSITHSVRPASIISPAHTVIEDETRRNLFWLAYCAERMHGASNGWAQSLDDQDISQLLPVRGDQFEQGVLVTPPDRQWAHTRDLLLTHPDKQTDSFVLYVKAVMMISKIKTFNLRFRSRHFFGDAAVMAPHNDRGNPLDPSIDPRGSPAFTELDDIANSFRASFPAHLRDPIVANVVDQHLYASCLMSHVYCSWYFFRSISLIRFSRAMILLHDPHANVRRSGCISALKILTAARSVLDLAYEVCNTTFDVTLLDPLCSYCWFISGRVLVRFLQAALDGNTTEQIATLRAETDFLKSAIAKIGQRIPLAFRYAKMLDDLIFKRCGDFPRTLDYELAVSIRETASMDGNMVTLHESLGHQGTVGYSVL